MPAFAVLEPPEYYDTATGRVDRFIFLREKFSLGAFLLGPLWMMWRRLWLELLLYLAGAAIIGYGLYALGVGWPAILLVFGLIQLLLGLEATALVHWMRVRYGWRDGGIVIADDLELAERRFFDSHLARRDAAKAAPMAASVLGPLPGGPVGASQTGVIGLFPEPGGGR